MNELMLEIVPPSRMTSEKYKEKVLSDVSNAVNEMKEIDLINVPEIIEENRVGKPYYRNISARTFAKKLNELTGKKVVVNKVVTYCNGLQELQDWLNKSIKELGIKDFVFVGANSDHFSYPGPSVAQANTHAKKIKGIRIGNIMIPSRENEAERMLSKTLSGADFFTSQLLFESQNTMNALKDYSELCKEKNVLPSEIFLSFCPVSGVNELYFLRWLGVEMPDETEKKLFGEEEKIVFNSVEIAEKIWLEINDFVKEENLSLSLNLNVEEIFLHNLLHCTELVSRLK
ncbi:MAG: hypothetical protein ABH986_03810 [archaeon]